MREKILFNDDWLFHEGDIKEEFPAFKGPVYAQAKTEHKIYGPASQKYSAIFDDFGTHDNMICTERWENVTLPHDYVIFHTPKKENNNARGFLEYNNAWYRKKFTLSDNDKNKRITLLFEGVATHCTVYLNGCVVKRNFCGYNSFEVDISDFVKFNEENTLAVYVSTTDSEGWWYEGGGIYANVYLIKTELVAIGLYGVYAMPKKTGDVWTADIEVDIINDAYEAAHVTAVTEFFSPSGEAAAQSSGELDIPQRSGATAKYKAEIKAPVLWDIDAPKLYTVVTRLYRDGAPCDEYITRTGFRTFEIDPREGLFLNGRHVKIKGVCAHRDFGLTGKAVPDNIMRYKVEMIKEMGANGYRTSHYPHAEATMDALDELGFIVMDETRWFSSTEEAKEQLKMLVKRDRNRPSVLFWSVGNEEPHHLTEEGRRICKSLISFTRKLDNTRFVMSAVSNDPDRATVYDELDAIGVNYNLDKYEYIHEKYPHKGIFASECCATGTTRGHYNADCHEKGYLSAYDKDTTNWFLGRENTWKFITERKWILGEYQWIAFDHRGEAVWPRVCSQSGAIDLFLQKKDAFYQNRSHWTENEPVIHLLPHWNFEGREGEEIPVWAYTNCEEAELFLNGQSLGRRKTANHTHAEWCVNFEKGEIRVVGINGGKEVCSDKKITSKSAASLRLRLENNNITANGRDIALVTCYCTDEDGNEVPTATPHVSFCTNGLGQIAGTGSSVSDHNPVNLSERKMYAGKISVAVRVGAKEGELKVYATADGLKDACLTISIKK